MAAGILLMLFLSAFIWDIQIQGNQAETKEELIRFLEDEGVYFGTWKERIDCRELAASMRRQFKNFTWVSVKIQGTQLCIDVQENKNIAETDIVKEKNAENQTSESGACQDLVSDVDGIVESIFTRRGIPHVKNGMEVKKGDIPGKRPDPGSGRRRRSGRISFLPGRRRYTGAHQHFHPGKFSNGV